jgi:protein TorT
MNRLVFGAWLLAFITSCSLSPLSAMAEPAGWAPFPVFEWVPPFQMSSPRKKRVYQPLDRASGKWLICVSIPHLKDTYWLAVNYGIADEAKRLGVRIKLFEAGGYDRLPEQAKQIENCLKHDPDAFIVSAIDTTGLNDILAKVHDAGVPVIDLINGVDFPDVSAKSLGDYYYNGFAAGQYVRDRHASESREINVLWFPGPRGASWVERGNLGFTEAIAGSNVNILETGHGDTGKRAQHELIEAALQRHPHVDYIVGTTVSAEAAVDIIRRHRLGDTISVLAYYFGPGVQRAIERGSILAAPTDMPAIQGRISVDQAVRIIENKPYLKHVGPQVQLIDRDALRDFNRSNSLAPRGFNAIFDVN